MAAPDPSQTSTNSNHDSQQESSNEWDAIDVDESSELSLTKTEDAESPKNDMKAPLSIESDNSNTEDLVQVDAQHALETPLESTPTESNEKDTGILAYPLHNVENPRRITYARLLLECCWRASSLQQLDKFTPGGIILLHFNDHLDNIVWFWSSLLAGCIPALSSPLPYDLEQRRQHLHHLNSCQPSPNSLPISYHLAKLPSLACAAQRVRP